MLCGSDTVIELESFRRIRFALRCRRICSALVAGSSSDSYFISMDAIGWDAINPPNFVLSSQKLNPGHVMQFETDSKSFRRVAAGCWHTEVIEVHVMAAKLVQRKIL